MSKRSVRENDCVDALHPAKLTRRMSELRLATADPDGVPPDMAEGEMDGVEARDFVYLNRQDVLDAINGVEIDDRFIKIPSSLTASPRDLPYFERPTQALIPYEAGPDLRVNEEDAMCEDD